MANILAIITAVVLAASAFIAYKNNQALSSEIEDVEIEQQDLEVNRRTLTEAQTERDDTIAERESIQTEAAEKSTEEESQQETNASLEEQIAEKTQQRDSNDAEIEEIRAQTAELGEVEDIAGDITALNNETQSLRDEKASKEAELANLLDERSGTDSRVSEYTEINSAVSNQRSYFDSARISAIYDAWGFVTLSKGNSQGVVAGSKLNVVRGGETVAQLRVKSVEAGRASADIIPDSLSEGVTLTVGDQVVPATESEGGSDGETAAPQQAAAN